MSFLSFSIVFLAFFASSLNAVCTPEECLESQLPAYGILKGVSKISERNKSKCHEELSRIKQGIDNLDRWAIKVLDSSGVPGSGVHWGAQNWLGSKSQCLASMSTKRVPVSSALGPVAIETEATVTLFPVAYFGAYFTHNSSILLPTHYVNERRITLGLCLPHSCDADDVGLLLQDYFDEGNLYFQHVYDTKFELEGVKKINDDDFSWLEAPRFQLFIKVFYAVLGLCVLGTVYDIFFYKARKIEHVNGNIVQNGYNGIIPNDTKVQNGYNGNIPNGKKVQNGYNGNTPSDTKVQNGYNGNIPNDTKVQNGYNGNIPSDTKVQNGYNGNIPNGTTAQNGHNGNIPNGTKVQNGYIPNGKKTQNHLTQYPKDSPLLLKILRNFSFFRTGEIIFNTNAKKGAILCINGIRVLSIIVIIWDHSIYYTGNHMDNRVYHYVSSADLGIFCNAPIRLETFFTMSGFLLSYIFLNLDIVKDKTKTLKQKYMMLPLGILKRYVRIVPAYLFTILLTDLTTTWRQRSSVFWTEEQNDLVCQKYWWRNLLFINNFYPRNEMCLSWSWYLSCDMQCYILGCVILILSTERFRLAVGILLSIILTSMVTTGIIVYKLDYIPFLDFQYATMEIFYDNTLLRAGPFLVGLLVGMLVHRVGLQPVLKKRTVIICWVIGFTGFLGNLFVYSDRLSMSLTDSIIFMVFSKVIWALTICWCMFACASGHGGYFGKFLSAKFWMPLSRLTFGVSLLNPLIIYFLYSLNEKGCTTELITYITIGLGYAVLSFIFSIFLSTMFELPFYLTLETIFEKNGKIVKTQIEDKKIS